MTSNYSVNPTVRPVTPRAVARVAPVRPAGYAGRYAYKMKRQLLLVCVGVMVVACNKATPAGFWNSYQRDVIVEQASDQGPWGGSRWIHWVSGEPNRFPVAKVVEFAEGHGWTCEEPAPYSADRTSTWVGSEGPVFPLFFGKPGDGTVYLANDEFPRHITTDSVIVRCETGWIRVAPGSGDSSPAYGYIQVSSDGRRMAVFHLWGEV